MSEYRSFEHCIICRSRDNLSNYRGNFEETMLINTLYMAVMFPIEIRQQKGTAKAKKIAQYLKDRNLVDVHGNDFDSDAIVRCLRNALAHFNVDVEPYNGSISSIKLWAINRPGKTVCKPENACEDPQCIPRQYKANENGEICTFYFSMSELREFTYFVVDHALRLLDDSICEGCECKLNKSC